MKKNQEMFDNSVFGKYFMDAYSEFKFHNVYILLYDGTS